MRCCFKNRMFPGAGKGSLQLHSCIAATHALVTHTSRRLSVVAEEEDIDYMDVNPDGKLTADDLMSLQKAGMRESEAAGVEMVIIESNPKAGQEPRKR